MKLRIAILDENTEFTNRLAKAFQKKFDDKAGMSFFSNADMLYQHLKEFHEDVVLFDQSIKIEGDKIPKGVVAGYLSNIANVNEIEGFPAIGKYQKTETIYRMILNMYAENSSDIKLKNANMNVRTILFTSVQGGGGTSTAAASYALRRAFEKKRMFYLNLEKFGNVNLYFTGNGDLSFSDVIYSLKSKKGNLIMKLESAAQMDTSGVMFFNSCRNAYDMTELQDEEMERLVQEITGGIECDEVVIDISGDLTERMLKLMTNYADKIVYVSDGSQTGNVKFKKFCEVSRVLEQKTECRILEKTSLLYNRYSSKNSVQLETAAVPVIGGVHRFEGIAGRELLEKVSKVEALGLI